MARGEWLRLALLCGAFWSVVLGFAGPTRRSGEGVRLLAGLALGAFLAHLGWALLHPSLVVERPLLLADVSRGHAVLFVPLGLVLAAPRAAEPVARARFLAAALRALLPGLAVARLGCLAAGCCAGRQAVAGDPALLAGAARLAGRLSGSSSRHPAALYEASLLLAVAWLLARAPLRRAPGMALGGIGAARLLVEPWRAPAPLEPLVPPSVLAAAWLAAGFWLLVLRARCARSARPAGPVLGIAP